MKNIPGCNGLAYELDCLKIIQEQTHFHSELLHRN